MDLVAHAYQVLLAHLIFCIVVLASDALFSTSLVTLPINWVLQGLLVDHDPHIVMSPYVTQSAFLIALTTLVLFYASGLYAEKISYANRCAIVSKVKLPVHHYIA